MKYLEAKRLAEQRAQEAEEEQEPEAKMDTGKVANKAVLDGPANKAEEWPLRMSPEQYVRMNADSDNPDVQAKVELARRILEAEA